MDLNLVGKKRITQLYSLIESKGLQLPDSITFDNDNRSIIQIKLDGKKVYDSYTPYEAIHYLKENNYLQEEN